MATLRQDTSRPASDKTSADQQPSWHALTVDDVARRLSSDAQRGLAPSDAARRLAEHGFNRLAEPARRSALAMFAAQFRSLIVLLLLAAAAIAFTLGDHIEGIAILVVVVLNAVIGFVTEWKAERALAALKNMAVPMAQVVRDGHETEIKAEEIVPGDLVTLAAGVRVPADGRVVESQRLQVDEAALTGESHGVEKVAENVVADESQLGDRTNMAYLGTTVTDGRGRMLVTATAAGSELGRIGQLIESAGDRATPLEEKLAQLGRLLVFIVLALCGVIVLVGWLRGVHDFWHMVEVGISLAIAAVPEGLPAVATMTLAIGMQRMARQRALIRRLPAVETLGSTTVICTDKTGTLTKNEMTVRALRLDARQIEVSGVGYQAQGEFLEQGATIDPAQDELLRLALRIGCLCNDAKVEHHADTATVLGDPTEAALVVAAEKAGLDHRRLRDEYPRVDEVPFDSQSKRMVTVHRAPDNKSVAYVKGAPGAVLAASHRAQRGAESVELTAEDRRQWEAWNEELAGGALRVLALAYRELAGEYRAEDFDTELVFVGLVGMIDPLRDEAKGAIEQCREAGIRTIMITGDQQPTAAEIARQLGIDRDLEDRPLQTVHARELANLDAAGWQRLAGGAAVFARVSPEHKLRIVEALQDQQHIVAMTGDGVNDAPALKKADIGVAMGIKGTEVAKENADMVITDDNFATIVGAIEQGRIIYANILRFIHYLLSCNLSEILTVFAAILIGWPLPLGALQILWLNMITDVFPALALALEPSSPDVMRRPPTKPNEALVGVKFMGLIAWQGALLAAATLVAFAIGMRWHGTDEAGLPRATTIAFATLSVVQVFHVFSARSQNRSTFTGRLFTNGWLWGAVVLCLLLQVAAVYWSPLQRVLRTTSLDASDWLLVLICAAIPVGVVEILKLKRFLGAA